MSNVTLVPAASSSEAVLHFARKLAFETDCWDVHDALSRGAADFVLLDVHMPGLPGDALAKLLSEGDYLPGIILHSATPKDVLAPLALSCGAIGVIEKTGDDEYFKSQLERCVRIKR